MKQLSLFALLLLSLASCTIRFDRAPKNTLNEFPEEFKGRYLFSNRKELDSTYVTITKNSISFSDNKILQSGGLSDSMKLAKGAKYYFLCSRGIQNNKTVWDVYPIKFKGKHLMIFALDAEYYKKSIKKYFKPIEGFEDLYVMDDKQLDKFCKKKLKNKSAIKLKRLE